MAPGWGSWDWEWVPLHPKWIHCFPPDLMHVVLRMDGHCPSQACRHTGQGYAAAKSLAALAGKDRLAARGNFP